MKVASTVLRGRGGGNVALLPDLPLYRQHQRLLQSGIQLSRMTLCVLS